MTFDINKSIEILSKTPKVLSSLLSGLSEEWIMNNEGKDTWSPYDVVGHLIHGEKTDWMVRARIILSKSENKSFEPFDRFAQMNETSNRTIEEFVKEFEMLRENNLAELQLLHLEEEDLYKIGEHPELGASTLKELLSTWVVHDLGHIAQISRVMAKQYKTEVGPWKQYLTILK